MEYLVNVAMAFSRLLNAVVGGRPTQSFSARMGYSRDNGCALCGAVCWLLTLVFRDGGHCQKAIDFDNSQAARELRRFKG